MARLVSCDKCGATSAPQDAAGVLIVEAGRSLSNDPYLAARAADTNYELCSNCLIRLKQWLTMKPRGEA